MTTPTPAPVPTPGPAPLPSATPAVPVTPPRVWPVLTLPNLWRLGSSPERVRAAGDAWGTLADTVVAARDRIDDVALPLRGDAWSGPASDGYHLHRTAVSGSVDDTAAAARTARDALHAAAGALSAAETALAISLRSLRGAVRTLVFGPVVWVHPRSDGEVAVVRRLVAEAQEIRSDLDDALAAAARDVATARVALNGVALRWNPAAEGTATTWTPPGESTRLTWIDDGERIVVSTGSGDDVVQVRVDPSTGAQIVTVNGRTLTFPAGRPVVIRTGSGNDEVTVAPGTTVRLTILTGEGDDWVTGGDGGDRISSGAGSDQVWGAGGGDRIYGGSGAEDDLYAGAGDDVVVGGAGRDYIDGGDGRDRLSGGEGRDVVYGMGGDDTVMGGSGNDYLEGARGDDTVIGGRGDDQLSGGRDDDTVHGGSGADVMYGGHGTDTLQGGTGSDTAYLQAEDAGTAEHEVYVDVSDAGSFIRVEGSPEFVARVEADLDMLRSSPTGQEMLAGLEKAHDDSDGWFRDGDGLRITELVGQDNGLARRDTSWGTQTQEIEYNPSYDYSTSSSREKTPVVVLYHEMTHTWDYMNETPAGTYNGVDAVDVGISELERYAVGLPVDHDGDPSTPEQLNPDHPEVLTENALRRELGLPPRPSYRTP